MTVLGKYTRTHFAEKLLWLDGKPLSLHDYPFFRAVYDGQYSELVLKTGRQVSKSTTCANLMIIDSVMVPHFRTLYISPSREQTSKFSNTRLTKIIHYSPLIHNTYVSPKLPNNVLLQILTNGSEIALSYADDDPDRIRGISADREFIDEVQDIVYDAVVPVVKECMANSDHNYIIYAGTPKTMENTIEFLWKRSTQTEWVMKCAGCGTHQFADSVKSVGLKGVICVKCGKGLNPRDGQWINFNPSASVKGFHISQLIMPKNNESFERWKRILVKLDSYSESKFKNEVLGVSDAIGSRCISQEELLELCDNSYFVTLPAGPSIIQEMRTIVAGIDWGGGSSNVGAVSRTVLWVYGLTQDFKLKTVFFKVFSEENPVANVQEIAEICQQCQCQYVIGDAGGGAMANAMLRDRLGQHRVNQVQYGGGTGFAKLIRWSKQAARYLVNRTAVIDSYVLALKNREVIFPHVRQMAVPISDIMNEYEETIEAGATSAERRIWNHAPSAPDDCLHAQVFAWIAMKIARGDMQFYEQREIA